MVRLMGDVFVAFGLVESRKKVCRFARNRVVLLKHHSIKQETVEK